MNRSSSSNPRSGFTLIELLIVIAIIAILAGLTLSTLGYVNRKGAESRARAEVAALSAAIESYKIDFGAYPAHQTNLFKELVGAGTVNSNKVYFEPTPRIASSMTNGPFIDPWGMEYQYSTNATVNVGFFDLWSYAGNSNSTNSNNWIRN
jgi:type II secretion system protein G